jgi:hypothetical protein
VIWKRRIPALTVSLFMALAAVPASVAATRRALLVGIDKYEHATDAKGAQGGQTRGGITLHGNSTRTSLPSLDGSINDLSAIRALLIDHYEFQEKDIRILENEEATADAILLAIQQHLVDRAQPGDVSFFYYAGHGSRMRNRSALKQSGYDSTIVPADWWQGTPDIRDKELARLFRKAVQKGVVLTIIADSCHSGALVRGAYKIREVNEDDRYVVDPPDRDSAGNLLASPEEEGALVLSATQDYEGAAEIPTDSGPHGAFTWALLQVLRYSPQNEPMSQIFQRVHGLLQSVVSFQEPVMAGKGRADRGLLGQPADSATSITVAVKTVSDTTLELQGGQVLGLAAGCELVRMPNQAGEAEVRIAITEVTGLSKSEAKILSGPREIVRPGDLFRLDKWVQPDSGMLRVYVPRNSPSLEQITAAAKSISELQLKGWVEDPTITPPDFVVRWDGSEWVLARNMPGGEVVRLGKEPDVTQIRKSAGDSTSTRLFLMLPPPAEVARELHLGLGTNLDAIVPVSSQAEARYAMVGRYRNAGIEYAWVAPSGSEEELRRIADEGRKRGTPETQARMPLRSKWLRLSSEADAAKSLAAQLSEYAVRILRVRTWIELEPPPADSIFPYSLEFQEITSQRMVTDGEMRKGEKYKLYLKADGDQLHRLEMAGAQIPLRRIYVFVIDSDGTGTPLFPGSQGNVENLFPHKTDLSHAPGEIPLTTRPWDFSISDPLGTDAYFMVVSDEVIDPYVFSFKGIRGDEGATRGSGGPLGKLLIKLGSESGVRGADPAPTEWSIDRRIIRSVAK